MAFLQLRSAQLNKEHDENDYEDVLGGDSQAVMEISDNVQIPPEEEVVEDVNAAPVHVPLSARSFNYHSSAEREISAVAVPVADANPSWPPPGGDTEVPMAYAVPVAEVISSNYHSFPGGNPPVAGSSWPPNPERHGSFSITKLAPVPESETVDLLEESDASDEQSSMELATQNPPTITGNTLHSADITEQALDTERPIESNGASPSREETVVPEDMESSPNGVGASARAKPLPAEQDSSAGHQDNNDSVSRETTDAERTSAVRPDSPFSLSGDNNLDDRHAAAAVKPPVERRDSSTSPPENNGRKPERRNVAVCGMSVKTMKGSRASATTFSLGDLAVPGSLKKKKKKKPNKD